MFCYNTLHDNLVYSVFVRAWYDDKRYYVYKSPGITVVSKPPTLTYLGGAAVKELEQTTGNKDIDYQINNNTIIVGWKVKFNGGIHGVDYYQIYISTHPQGHNIHRSDTKLSPQQKSFSISGVKLQEDKIYYSTVLAFNKAGLCSWSTSDGIIIDSTPPSTGIIHDGLDPHDSEYQSSDSLLAASWYGFSDIGSGIVNYIWCVGRQNDSTTCDILPWTNVGLKIKTTDISPMELHSGDKIYHKVYAVDGSGLQSQVAVSNGIIIDTSPPEPSYLEFIGENLILNPSFESISDDTTTSCNSNIPEDWSTDSQSCVKTRSSQHSTAHDGEVYITITDQIQQTIQNLDTDCSYQLTVHVGYPHDILLSHHMVEGFIRLGHEINSFKLNPDLCQGDCSELVDVIHWYKFNYIYQPINTREKLVIGTTRNNMILAIDDLELRKINHVSLKDTNNNHIVYHPTFTPHWSSLHFNWYIKDRESSIVEYQWALGTVKGGTQIREFTTTGDRSHVTVSNLPLDHNTRLYFTVKARNGADLTSLSHSNYMLVDTTPPVVIYIHDGTGGDVNYQTRKVIAVNWKIEDPQSGIDYCLWAIGSVRGGNDIQKFTRIQKDENKASREYTEREPIKVYSTIRCYNKVGLQVTVTTDGVQLIDSNKLITNDRDIKIAKTLDGLTLMISWTDIFESYWKDLTYEVSLGTKQGGGDVMQWQETKDKSLRLTLPKHSKYKYLFLTLTAVDPCGLFSTIQKTILL
ncbi:hypothetical protein LOTGIDRAFT_165389 [Lottia gigantea]|uniref:Fibronectin type-III domain-containing protein n=1 Tax=Lottia gigantea TaxID=225164 RepID=V4A0Z3_LOTGI|nr:hypothetical protein LOTGIDRAFT_165389 [Lottia gigantea]ESO88605.1 hypothetical protein LOTGIDRAFT_165389 [Lottia gigantea]